MGAAGMATQQSDARVPARPSARILSLVVPATVVFAIVVAIWEVLVRTGAGGEFGLPAPLSVGAAVIELAQEEYFYEAVRTTTLESAYGFIVGASAGFALGVLIGSSEIARRTLHPFVVLFQSMPKPALAPMF